jgi:hypothetical protein
MSAPRTDIEKQTRWHKWPLIGMALAVLIGVGSAFLWLTDEVAGSDPPDNEEVEEVTVPPADPGT